MTGERKDIVDATPDFRRVRTYSAEGAASGPQTTRPVAGPQTTRPVAGPQTTRPVAGPQTAQPVAGQQASRPGAGQDGDLEARRYATVSRPPHSRGSAGLLPLESTGLLAGGGLLIFLGLKNWRSFFGLGLAGVGSGLVYSALKNNRVFDPDIGTRLLNTMATRGSQVDVRMMVARPVGEVWAAWRNFENLGHCLEHIEAVQPIDKTRYHWVARVPKTDTLLQWDAEIIDEVEQELLVWRSIAGSEINNEGMVEFVAMPDGQNTEIRARIVYFPPAGAVGQTIADFLSGISRRVIEDDLQNFKNFVEMGQITAD